jgi:hypothetical protein
MVPQLVNKFMEELSSHWTDFLEILYLYIFLKSVEKIEVLLKSDITSTLHKDHYKFMIISRLVLLG